MPSYLLWKDKMRIPKKWATVISKKIIENLIEKNVIEEPVDVKTLIEETEKIIIDELMVEDRLNEEVKHLLKNYATEIEKGRLDYWDLFRMTKQKLIKEKQIIL